VSRIAPYDLAGKLARKPVAALWGKRPAGGAAAGRVAEAFATYFVVD
jgi:hypothetical protein